MRKFGAGHEEQELYLKARRVRQTFAELFEAPPAGRIILVPGILGALQILFAKLAVRRIVLTDAEYYGAVHFPAQQVVTTGVGDLIEYSRKFKPDVVIVSVVTWQGEALPCGEIFAEIRRRRGREKIPLLVADYCHAGAVGFPSARKLGADMVCGGVGKWITPPLWDSKLSFLWLGSGSLFSMAKSAFTPFFLATEQPAPFLVSRWMDPAEVRAVDRWLEHRRLDRSALAAQYRTDREFTLQLAAQFGIECPQTNILWLTRRHSGDKRVMELERAGLTWRMPDGSIRVLCRASAGAPILSGRRQALRGKVARTAPPRGPAKSA
jgi:hypothetical protein